MELATNSNICAQLTKALGLEGQNVVSLVIRVKSNDVVEVDVTRHVGLDAFQKVITEIAAYKLVGKAEPKANPFPQPEPDGKRRILFNYG